MTAALEHVQLETPSDPIYLRSWARIPVRMPASMSAGGTAFDDLLFSVEPPDVGCGVSHSRDGTFDSAEPHVVLYTGSLAGEFTMRAIDKRSGGEVASANFRVDYGWTHVDGPPVRIIGTTEDAPPVFDVLGTRKVAIVLLETTDVDPWLQMEADAVLRRYRDQVFDGVTVDGRVESAAAYLEEVSWQKFRIENAGVVGPLRLTMSWDQVGPVWDHDRKLWRGVLPFSDAGVAEILRRNRELAEQGEGPLVDLNTVESIIFVVRAFDGPDPEKRRAIWPWATGGAALDSRYDVDGDPTTPDRLIETIVMPDDWPSAGADQGGRIRYTAAHELCHNIGLFDQYTGNDTDADFRPRDVTEWTLMAIEQKFPNLTVPERRKLGWLESRMVKKVAARPGGAITDETVNLCLASQRPRPREFTAIEIELSDTTSYFLELRGKSPGTIADRNHTPQIVGTDWTESPAKRPQLLRMRNDEDNDRGTYKAGEDYDESTTVKPQFPVDLKVSVISLTDDTAQVRVQFGDRKPDPALTPFSAAMHWQSPDIEVRNERNTASPELFNLPWAGHPNTLIAKVRNEGNFAAKRVRVEFWEADFTLSSNPEFTFLTANQQDVAAGATVEFVGDTQWTPEAAPLLFGTKHYCIKAEVVPYVHPDDSSKVEINPTNNVAQSNYSRFISIWASPASREFTQVALWGDARGTRQHVKARQTSPFARTFVDHRWLDVRHGNRRDVKVFTEFMVGDESVEEYVESLGGIEEAFRTPNQLDLSAVLENRCSGSVLGGASITVPVAQRTRFTRFGVEPGGSFAFGSVAGASDGPLLVSVRPEDSPAEEVVFATTLQGGDFGVDTGHGLSGRVAFRAHYLGEMGSAPSDSRVLVEDV
ncbi:hypothetical protein [Mycolicibacterium gadium]|uniref:hypothetical protein n=1 Tax=Mycolicibacterium gadium TaxID=1794 RepID=UPI0013CF9F66|nr:hypothetical protein [Mycolicibacterium gadium]